MSHSFDAPPKEVEILAGEYVLGVLEDAERHAVRRQALVDPQLERAIAFWEHRLTPLASAAPRATPPSGLWTRIEQGLAELPEARLDGARPTAVPSTPARAGLVPVAPPRTASSRVWPWKVATFASLALAAGIAGVAVIASPELRGRAAVADGRDADLVAVLTPTQTAAGTQPGPTAQMAVAAGGEARLVEPETAIPARADTGGRDGAFLAVARPDGTVELTVVAGVQVPDGKMLELWIQPARAAVPRSLGPLPTAGRRITLSPAPLAGTKLMVSLEPAGGSPTGVPTGSVVYAGTLQRMAL